MAAKTFDNLGNGSGTWEDGTDWDPVGVPADGDSIVIAANCNVTTNYKVDRTFIQLTVNNGVTLTVDNGADLKFDTNTCDFSGNLTVKAGGTITFEDITELETNGLVTLDGGTVEIVETDASLITWEAKGTGIVGTANGGTIKLVAATLDKAKFLLTNVSITGDSNCRIIVDGDSGASAGYVVSGGVAEFSYVDFDGTSHVAPPSKGTASFDHCLFHNMGTVFELDEQFLFVRDSFIYSNTNGLKTLDPSWVEFNNVVFGKTQGAVGAENEGYDVDIDKLFGTFHNCELASTTAIQSDGSSWRSLSFTSYDQDETDWLHYQGRGHLALPEFGAGAQGGAGTAVKCVTSANAADTDISRFRRLVGFIPATHGDILAVTLYIKGTNATTAKLRIDPDSIYGTTQVWNETADGNWNQRTIPNYTVNVSGGAGTKVCIPIYLDMYGASETWYYDTLDWTVS